MTKTGTPRPPHPGEPFPRLLGDPAHASLQDPAARSASPPARAAALLARLPKPPPLSPVAHQRIDQRLILLSHAPAARPWPALALAAAVGVASFFAGFVQRPPAVRSPLAAVSVTTPRPSLHTLVLADGGAAVLGGGAHLIAHGHTSLTVLDTGLLHLTAGRVLLKSGVSPLSVQVSTARIEVPAGRLIEVAVSETQLPYVAAYVGSVPITTSERVIELAERTIFSSDGTQHASPACLAAASASAALPPSLPRLPWPGPCLSPPPPSTESTPPAPQPVRPFAVPSRPHPKLSPASVAAVSSGPPTVPTLAGSTDAAPVSSLASETRLLGQALIQLRSGGRPLEALRFLDAYQAAHPTGVLAEEARAARVDAFMALHRPSDALTVLLQRDFQRLARGGELTLLRAELLAGAGRCGEAVSDFSAVLSTVPSTSRTLRERALYGQATCQLRLGARSHARALFAQHLAQFPTGPFAAQVQQALAGLGSSLPSPVGSPSAGSNE